MLKDHEMWMKLKKKIDVFEQSVQFKEREIWWCASGINVGHEQDGKGRNFRRPVLIIKKFNNSVCWIIPLTSSPVNKPYQLHIRFGDKMSQVIVSQLRLIDEKRLVGKMGKISTFQFDEIRKTLGKLLFPQAFSSYEIFAASCLDIPSPRAL